MAVLPSDPDIDQLRRQAKELLRSGQRGEVSALTRIGAVGERLDLSTAQLALAREYGFASWPKLKLEVKRRRILDERDLGELSKLISQHPDLATSSMENWCDHPRGASPLGYIAMLRFDTGKNRWRDLSDTAEVARTLIAAGASVDGDHGDTETPLMTAASYGDAAVARVLVEAGADLNARASEDAGGVPGGTALLHAAVFGMTDVVDVLVAAGAMIHGIEEAAAAGEISGWLQPDTPTDARIRALVMAADHQRLDVIDQLIAAGTPVDGVDPVFGGHPLRQAAGNGRPASVRRLLGRGADPNLIDPDHGLTPLGWCLRNRSGHAETSGFHEVESILRPLTRDGDVDET
ncbi:MAG: ankyrin repeat domain-containing protein [Acidimicrobiia bacterium]